MEARPTRTPRPQTQQGVDRLLQRREAEGLRWGLTVRFVIIAMGFFMLPATSVTLADTIFTGALLMTGVAICSYGYIQARQEQHLGRVGWMCVAFDAVTLASLPISWYNAVGGDAVSPSFLLKNDFLLLCLMLIAANGLTLRPVFPLTTAGVSLSMYVAFVIYGYGDPRLILDNDIRSAVLGVTVHPGLFGWRFLTIAFFGGLFAWMAGAGHRTVHKAVQLEHANAEIRRQQAEIVMQGRLSALAGLVAGVAHEINTPLGVARSCVQTVERCATRISESAGSQPERSERAVALLGDSVSAAREAVDRIDALVRRLKDFAGLDQSDIQAIQLETALDRTLDLIDPEVKREARVERAYGETAPLRCRPKEINQVFYTLIMNAFQALKGGGALRLETSQNNGEVVVEIADTGPGIESSALPNLFDIRLAPQDRRVGMRLGLPMARYIVESHGGSIEVNSKVGDGTTFRVCLPAS